jgi:hypothetical protein
MGQDVHAARSAAYRQIWGEPTSVIQGAPADVPRIDVQVYAPRIDENGMYRDYYVLVTSGMSDLPMTFPPDATPPFHRAELVMYVPELTDEHVGLLQFVARYPHASRRYYVYGHTIPYSEPFFTGSTLSVALLLQSPYNSHARLPEVLELDGQPVELLWLQPITTKELTVKREHGIDALLALFAHHRLPFVLDERRASLV